MGRRLVLGAWSLGWTTVQDGPRHAMDASSSKGNAIVLLKRLLEILEEENVFDRADNEPVVRFVQPEELQVRSWYG